MASYCQHCGSSVGSDWEYCRACGQHLEQPDGPSTSPSPSTGSKRSHGRSSAAIVAGVVLVALLAAGGAVLIGYLPIGSGQQPSEPQPVAGTDTPSPVPTSLKPAAPENFAVAHERIASGVVRLDVLSCDDSGFGSGFLINEQLVATAAHVVDGAATIGLTAGESTTTGTVIGLDPANDLALVRAERPLDGEVLSFADGALRPGLPVAALGYPAGNPLSMTSGSVSALDRTLELQDGSELEGLVQTDAAVNPGNSGGPLINAGGQVVGVVVLKDLNAEGIAYAVSTDTARPRLERWAASPSPRPPADCDRPLGPADTTSVEPPSDPAGEAIATALFDYFDGINAGDYRRAWSQLSPAAQQRNPYDQFVVDTSTSYDLGIRVQDVTQAGPGRVVVYLRFTSLQAPGYGPDGETCTNWWLDYHMIQTGPRWLIDSVQFHSGTPGHRPC